MAVNFGHEIDSITQKNRHMGIVEMIKERETQKILQRGIAEDLEKGKAGVARSPERLSSCQPINFSILLPKLRNFV